MFNYSPRCPKAREEKVGAQTPARESDVTA